MAMTKPVSKVEEPIELATQTYWAISSAFRGRLKNKVSFKEANKFVNEAISRVGPERTVRKRLYHLHNELVHGKTIAVVRSEDFKSIRGERADITIIDEVVHNSNASNIPLIQG